jgi:hypothetical protein
VREMLNDYRQKKLPADITTHQYPIFDPTTETKKKVKNRSGELTSNMQHRMTHPKYRVGDLVNVILQEPVNALGKKHTDKRFRMGDYRLDKKKRKIIAVLYYADIPPYRYLIEGFPNASYTEDELRQV